MTTRKSSRAQKDKQLLHILDVPVDEKRSVAYGCFCVLVDATPLSLNVVVWLNDDLDPWT